jgi:hypothetical protein
MKEISDPAYPEAPDILKFSLAVKDIVVGNDDLEDIKRPMSLKITIRKSRTASCRT